MHFESIFILIGVGAAAGGLYGIIRIALSMGDKIDNFDSKTRKQIKLLKPKIWGDIVSPATKDLYEFCRLSIADKKNSLKSIEQVFHSKPLQKELAGHLIDLSLALDHYRKVLTLKESWRRALKSREKSFVLIGIADITTSAILILFGNLGEVEDSIANFVAVVIVGFWVASFILLIYYWVQVIHYRETHGKLWDLVDDED